MASDRERKNSFFTNAFLATPTLVGAGIFANRIASNRSLLKIPSSGLPVNQVQNAVRDFASMYTRGKGFSEYRKDKIDLGFSGYRKDKIGLLEDLAKTSKLSASQVREAAYRIASHTDPTGTFTQVLNERLGPAATGSQALSDLANILRENGSVYVNRSTEMLADDLATLSNRAELGLPLEGKDLVPKVPRRTTTFDLRQHSPWMAKEYERIQNIAGPVNIGLTLKQRRDREGGEYILNIARAREGTFQGELSIKIPRTLKSKYTIQQGPLKGMGTVATRGSTQQSKYVTGIYGLVEEGKLKQVFTHEQWVMHRAVEELLPELMTNHRLSRREINRRIREFESRMIETGSYVHSVSSSLHAGPEEYIKSRSPVINLFKASGKTEGERYAPLGLEEYANLIQRGGLDLPGGGMLPLFPGAGPSQINSSIASLIDTAEGQALVPWAFPYAKRPLQSLREQFAPTPAAAAAMEANPLNKQFAWAMRERGSIVPIEKIAYISSSRDAELRKWGWSSEGMMMHSLSRQEERATEKLRQVSISSKGIQDLASFIDPEKGSQWTIDKIAERDLLLGYHPSTGRPVTIPKGSRLLEATAFDEDAAKGDFIQVMFAQKEESQWQKYFGASKAVSGEVKPGFIKGLLGKVGLDPYKLEGEAEVTALVTMDELKKNSALLYDQLFTSLWEYSKSNMASGKTMSELASNFAADPYKIASRLAEEAKNIPGRDEALVRTLFGVARGAGLTPSQMGRVFGAIPEVFSSRVKELGLEGFLGGKLTEREIQEINLRAPLGWGQFFAAGYGPETGVGARGTLEPRAYELLGAPHWGELGPKLQEDIASRMMAEYPERLFEQAELGRSLETIRDLTSRGGSKGASELLAGLTEEEILPRAGSHLKVLGGEVYIPGASTVGQLTTYKTGSGATIDSPLAHSYRNLIETTQAYDARNATRAMVEKSLGDLAIQVAQAHRQTVLGPKGSQTTLLRGRIPGSRTFRSIVAPAGVELAEGELGITREGAKKMFDDMRSLANMGLYNEEDIITEEAKFFAGGRVAGLTQRHPHISPYSTQASYFKLVEGIQGDVIMHPERRPMATVIRGRLEGEALENFNQMVKQGATSQLEEMGADIISTPLRLGQGPGQGLDFDADFQSAILAGPKLSPEVTRYIEDPTRQTAYRHYALRRQLMTVKARTATGELSLRTLMAGDVYKLSTTSSERLGRLSNLMQEYRAAALMKAGGITDEQADNILGLMDWMEQEPIAGKKKEQEIIEHFEDMRRALQSRKQENISSFAIKYLDTGKESARAALHEGFTIALQEGGRISTEFVPGTEINKTAAAMQQSIEGLWSTAEGREVAGRIRQLAMGKGKPMTAEETFSLLSKENLAKTPFGSFFRPAEKEMGFAASMAQRALSFQNKMATMGKGLLQQSKPLALGLGISLGLSALLSEPPRVLPPEASVAPRANTKSGTGGENLRNIHPDNPSIGSPTAADLTSSQHSARVTPDSGYRISIRGNSRQKIDYGSLSQHLRSATGARQTSSTVQDRRGSLTPQKLSSILRG